MVLAVAHPWASASSYLSSQSVADSRCNPHATPRSSYSRRSPSCRFFLCRAALLCLVLQRHRAACRSLALAASPASRRSSALLAAYCGPSSLSSSPLARTTLLTPTPIICRPVMLLLRSTLSSITCTFIDGVGTGVPFGYVVTADDGITTGVSSSSSSSSPAASRSSLRSAWLTLHAVNIRPTHPIFFSRSSARALDLSLLRTHVRMAIEAAFPTTCSSLVTSPASSFLFLASPPATRLYAPGGLGLATVCVR